MVSFCTCCDGTIVLLPNAALLVFGWSSFFTCSVKCEDLMTEDQSLLRISIALWAIVASLIVVLASLRLGSLFVCTVLVCMVV